MTLAPQSTGPGTGAYPAAPRLDPGVYFSVDAGLKVELLAQTVRTRVTYGIGELDGRFYVYDHGVWRFGEVDISRVLTELLGNRYRRSHLTNVLDMLRFAGDVPVIDCGPTPDWVNCANGLVWWRDRTLHPPHAGAAQRDAASR